MSSNARTCFPHTSPEILDNNIITTGGIFLIFTGDKILVILRQRYSCKQFMGFRNFYYYYLGLFKKKISVSNNFGGVCMEFLSIFGMISFQYENRVQRWIQGRG